jgi:chorismate synthase
VGRLRFVTAGESHGVRLTAILEGLPAGIPIDQEALDAELQRRQGGYGRGARMQIEQDHAQIVSGVRQGHTLGSPVTLQVPNKDDSIDRLPKVTHPRPGHADLTGALKYDHRDIRNVLERASARETAARVAVGAVCKQLLEQLGITIFSHVVRIGSVLATPPAVLEWSALESIVESSPVRCADGDAATAMIAEIDATKKQGDTLGGVFEVVATDVPPGLGSYVHYDRRLDAILGRAILSIHAVKGVEVGDGMTGAQTAGSGVQDEITYAPGEGFSRMTNRAGGLEGGMTTGEPVVVRGYIKPISTLMKPLRSVDIETKEAVKATVERSDVVVVPAAGIVGESMIAFELANAMLEKFGGDSLREIQCNLTCYRQHLANF